MTYLFVLLFLLSLLALIIGVLAPNLISRLTFPEVFTNSSPRKRVVIVFGSATVVFYFMFMTAVNQQKNAPVTSSSPNPVAETSPFNGNTKSNSNNTSTQVAQPDIALPATEVAFIDIIKQMTSKYIAAQNELQKSSIRTQRAELLATTLKNSTRVDGWIGIIREMSTNSEGKAILAIRLDPSNIELKTWNNAISDVGDDTLIDHQSRLYNKISDMKKGQRIVFNGSFIASERDFVKEGSMSEGGSMTRPEFIFKFINVTDPSTTSNNEANAATNEKAYATPVPIKKVVVRPKAGWEKTWSEVKQTALKGCAKTFEEYQLQAVCMQNERDGYDKMQSDFGLPPDVALKAKVNCEKIFEMFQMQAVCMTNEKEGYYKIHQ